MAIFSELASAWKSMRMASQSRPIGIAQAPAPPPERIFQHRSIITRPMAFITSTRCPLAVSTMQVPRPGATGRPVQRPDQIGFTFNENQRFALVKGVVAKGYNIRPAAQQFLVNVLADAESHEAAFSPFTTTMSGL
jgi:hypothetical protein